MPSNDREVFQHFLNDSDASLEVAHLAYAAYASGRYDWVTLFEERKGRLPSPEEVDEWIASLPPSRFIEIREAAAETFDLAATAYMASRIEAEKEQAVRASILDTVRGIQEVVAANNREVIAEARVIRTVVERATSFRGTFVPNTITGVIASFAFALIVLAMAVIFHDDPSIFALFKSSSDSPAVTAPPVASPQVHPPPR